MIDELVAFTTQPAELLLTATDRVQINHTMQRWFTATPKRALPDLVQRELEFRQKLTQLSRVIKLKYSAAGKGAVLISEASGDSSETLAQLKAGTLWFDGWRALEYELLCVVQE